MKAALNQPEAGEKDEPDSGVTDTSVLVTDQRTSRCRSEAMQRRVQDCLSGIPYGLCSRSDYEKGGFSFHCRTAKFALGQRNVLAHRY